MANPRRPAKKRRTPGAYGGTGLVASGIDGLESGLLDRLFVQDPASAQLLLCV